MTAQPQTKRRPGRPPRNPQTHHDTQDTLIRAGLVLLTTQGFTGTSLDTVLKQVGIPKGSFYHYFQSKEAFGKAVIQAYATYFDQKLERWLEDTTLLPLERLQGFAEDAMAGLQRHQFNRGCLVGNLNQEVELLPIQYRDLLQSILQNWEQRLEQCLQLACKQGQLAPTSDCQALARFFWIGWEGAIMRARLSRSREPLTLFITHYLSLLPRP